MCIMRTISISTMIIISNSIMKIIKNKRAIKLLLGMSIIVIETSFVSN